jgi:hypothetical protein
MATAATMRRVVVKDGMLATWGVTWSKGSGGAGFLDAAKGWLSCQTGGEGGTGDWMLSAE